MKAKWDGSRIVNLTDRYKAALMELVEAEIEMMRRVPGHSKEDWTWGEATVDDLSNGDGLSLHFGGDDNKPKELKTTARIIVL